MVFLLGFLLPPFNTHGQASSIPPVFKEDFTTIVRLYINGNKSRFLQNIIDTSEDTKEIERAQKELISHTNSRKAYFQYIKSAFASNYDQSPVLFVPDSLVTQLYEGVKEGIFYGDNGLISNDISLKTKSYILIGRGSRDDDFLILDEKGQPFGGAVPTHVKLSLLTRLKSLFTDDLNDAVSHLNKTIDGLVKP